MLCSFQLTCRLHTHEFQNADPLGTGLEFLGLPRPFLSMLAISLCFFFCLLVLRTCTFFFSSNFFAIVATGTVASSDSLRSSPKVDVLQPSGVPHDSGTLSFHSYLILVMKLAPFNSFVCEEYFWRQCAQGKPSSSFEFQVLTCYFKLSLSWSVQAFSGYKIAIFASSTMGLPFLALGDCICTLQARKKTLARCEKSQRIAMRNPSAVSWTQTTSCLLNTKSLYWAFISQAFSEPPNFAIAREITLSCDEISGLGRVELEPPPKPLQQLHEKQYSCCLFVGMVGINCMVLPGL